MEVFDWGRLADQELFCALRRLSVAELGLALLSETPPNLRATMPQLAPDEAQKSWTGASGETLMRQSVEIVSAFAAAFERYTAAPLTNKTILDYGCGWGRLILLMYAFSGPDKIYGCDPWAESLELCRRQQVQAHLKLCDYVPKAPVYGPDMFDFAYAFSVFTHLSEKTCAAVLAALHHSVKKGGVLAITIRPPEYWDYHQAHDQAIAAPLENVAGLKQSHAQRGFAFAPHNRAPIDGDITYGDTSISLDYIRARWTDWRLLGSEVNASDSLQTLVYLAPYK